jgi:SulP family sulfate permease
VILDFRNVTGIDATAALSFAKLLDLTDRAGVRLVITGLAAAPWGQLERGGLHDRGPDDDSATGVHRFADLDRGLEWCEERVLASATAGTPATSGLLTLIPDPVELDNLLRRLDRLEIEPGDRLMLEGDRSTELYLIESGTFTVGLERPGSAVVRLQTTHGSQILGELGFFLGAARTATVVCDEPAVVYRLTVARWAEIRAAQPEVAQTLDAAVIATLGERVAHLAKVVDALQGS